MTQKSELASRWQRLGASMIDGVFLWIIVAAIGAAAYISGVGIDGQTGDTLVRSLAIYIVPCLYSPIFTVIWGATPGKRVLGLKVVSDDGTRLSTGKVILRELFGKWGGAVVLGHLWLFFNKRKKTAWDYLVGSVVVRS